MTTRLYSILCTIQFQCFELVTAIVEVDPVA